MYPILKEIQILIILLLYPLKGGDPPTASATGALLRLRPYHRSHLPPPYGDVRVLPTLLT